MIQRPSLRTALVISAVLHGVAAIIAVGTIDRRHATETDLVDIELAPPPPRPEALPPEVARPPEQDLAGHDTAPEPESTPPDQPGEAVVDAGIDAAIDAAIDAPIDAPIDARPDARPDAAPDASPDAPPDAALDVAELAEAGAPEPATDAGPEPSAVALGDPHGVDHAAAAGDDALPAALADAGPGGAADEAATAVAGTRSASAAGAGAAGRDPGARADAVTTSEPGPPLDTAALAAALGAGSGVAGATDEPAVEGEPTTAGTAANLLSYFPDGHVVTALIRFDRLRGTEWSAQTERLLRPMPDYQLLFGAGDAGIADRLDTLVISTPRPRDAAATTLVARTSLARASLREFLARATPVTWSTAKGGLLGKRTGRLFPGDRRVFLSPFLSWFLLAPPDDLGALTDAAKGRPDAAVATAKLPPWLAGIRKIEAETGDPRGPALVLTLGLRGKRLPLAGNDFGLGISSVPTPDRVSLAMELVKQGWLVRGNLRFVADADAAEFVATAQRLQQQVADSRAIQLVIGKPVVHVVANLAFARNGPRVSYATSISIADARAILAAAARQLDQYYGRAP